MRPAPDDLVEAALEEVSALLGCRPSELRRASGAGERLTYLHPDVVLHLTPTGHPGVEHEHRALHLLAGRVPAPLPVRLGRMPGSPSVWSLQTRLPGQSLEEAWGGLDVDEREVAVIEMCRLYRLLHALPVPQMNRAADADPLTAWRYPDAGLLLRSSEEAARRGMLDGETAVRVQTWALEHTTALEEGELTWCHRDLGPRNVMWHEGKVVGIIDWESSGADPVDMELPCALMHATAAPHGTPEDAPLAELYREHLPYLHAHPEHETRLQGMRLGQWLRLIHVAPDRAESWVERLKGTLADEENVRT